MKSAWPAAWVCCTVGRNCWPVIWTSWLLVVQSGPLLFLVYINDICNSCNRIKFYLFADDTNLLYADKNLKSQESTVNDQLCKLYDWLIANKLSLNIKNSNYVIFRPRQKMSNRKLI